MRRFKLLYPTCVLQTHMAEVLTNVTFGTPALTNLSNPA